MSGHWNFDKGMMREKGSNGKGGLVFHVPWTDEYNRPLANPNFHMVPQQGTWFWDRCVFSSFEITPDGAWQFIELVLSEAWVQGAWAQAEWARKNKSIIDRNFQEAELKYATMKYTQQFGWFAGWGALPGKILQWYRAGMGPNLPIDPKDLPGGCTPHSFEEQERARKDPLERLVGYGRFCPDERIEMTKRDAGEIAGTIGETIVEIGAGIGESTVGQTIGSIVGDTTGAVTLTPEDKKTVLPNALTTADLVLYGIIALAGVVIVIKVVKAI
jgi:hypothetical protein